MLAGLGAEVNAQSVRLTPTVTGRITATNNAGFTAKDQATSDVIFSVAPALGVSVTGANYSLQGTVGFDAVKYAGGEQPSRLFPQARLGLTANPVDRIFFLDASIEALTISSDAFDRRIDASLPYSADAATQYTARLSPYIRTSLRPNVVFLARSDNSWIRRSNDGATLSTLDRDARFQRNLIRLEREPVPLGVYAELSSEETRYRDQSSAGLSLEAVRAGVNYRVDPQWVIGLIAGREHSVFSLTDEYDSIRGISLRWTPTERTNVAVSTEKRFFGQGWDVSFSHRSPLVAVSGGWLRRPVTDLASLGVAPAGSDLAGLLDAIFTTRIPNPADRARAVQDYLLQRNLPSTLTEAIEIFGRNAQLSESGSISLVLMGVRQLVSFTLFTQRDSALAREDQPLLVVAADESRQYGGSVLISRQLTPQRTAEMVVTGVATDGQGLRQGDHSRDWTLTLSVTESLTPRSSVTFGFNRQIVRSNVVPSAQETRIFGGLSHRF